MILRILVITTIIFILPSKGISSSQIKFLSNHQKSIIHMAYEIGKEVKGCAPKPLDGCSETLAGIAFLESSAGHFKYGDTNKEFGKRSYGITHMKLIVARYVLKQHPELGEFDLDEKLIVELVTNDTFSLKLTAFYLQELVDWHKEQYKGYHWSRTVHSYSTGQRRVEIESLNEYVVNLQYIIKTVIRPLFKRDQKEESF